MKVLRISTETVDPPKVEELNFDKDQLWRYDVVGRVGSKVFIAERYAKVNYLASNQVANQLADRLATKEDAMGRVWDAVSDRTKSPASPEELHGPVMVAYYDRLVDRRCW